MSTPPDGHHHSGSHSRGRGRTAGYARTSTPGAGGKRSRSRSHSRMEVALESACNEAWTALDKYWDHLWSAKELALRIAAYDACLASVKNAMSMVQSSDNIHLDHILPKLYVTLEQERGVLSWRSEFSKSHLMGFRLFRVCKQLHAMVPGKMPSFTEAAERHKKILIRISNKKLYEDASLLVNKTVPMGHQTSTSALGIQHLIEHARGEHTHRQQHLKSAISGEHLVPPHDDDDFAERLAKVLYDAGRVEDGVMVFNIYELQQFLRDHGEETSKPRGDSREVFATGGRAPPAWDPVRTVVAGVRRLWRRRPPSPPPDIEQHRHHHS